MARRMTLKEAVALQRRARSVAGEPPPAPQPDDVMNRTECRYAEVLEVRKRAGEVREWRFEPFSLRLAPRTFYRPDFLVELAPPVHHVCGVVCVHPAGHDGKHVLAERPVLLGMPAPRGRLEIHEVKGFWRDDARVKIKVAAVLHPWFRFVAVRLVDGRWEYEEIPAA